MNKDATFQLAHQWYIASLFKDNSGALELARVPKILQRTKHINIVYHHFRSYVRDEKISIWPINTNDQPADMLTKPLPVAKFGEF